MLVGYILFEIICIIYGIQCLRVARLQWRGDATAGMPKYRGIPIDIHGTSLRGLYRARLPLGICSLAMAGMLPGVLMVGPGPKPPMPVGLYLAVDLLTLVLSGIYAALVQYLGRPRFLIPPILR